MYKKYIKIQIMSLCLFLCLGMMPMIPKVLAAQALQTENGIVTLHNGNAKIVLQGNEKQTLVGKEFGVYQLFDAQSSKDQESIVYHVNKTYEKALQNVVGKKLSKAPALVSENEIIATFEKLRTSTKEGNESAFRYFMEDVQAALSEVHAEPIHIQVKDCISGSGNVEIKGLAYGYYTVVELTDNQNKHAATSLCMVSTANPNTTIQIKSDYPTIEKKIKEDDNNVGWNDIGDYEIGQTIPYKYTINVPNMSGYKKYYVTFHDKMDDALNYDKNSFKLELILEDGTRYNLEKGDDFIIRTALASLETGKEQLKDGCRFEVQLLDLKATYERLTSKKDEYKGKIVLTYNASLNEKAAIHTGRPGFENDVKLTFSNNPNAGHEDEMGETPWDTVVCFTYKIHGTKINNQDKVLEGAKFKLYRDEACLDQVLVSKNEAGYVVRNQGAPETGYEEFIVSGKNGEFIIYGLDQGTYYLKEVEAPAGYRLLESPIKLVLTPTFTENRNAYLKGEGAGVNTLISLKATADFKTFFDLSFTTSHDDLITDVETGSVNLKVINKVGMQLPVTGSSLTLILVVAGCACMMIGFYAMNKKKQKSLDTEGYESQNQE